MKISRGAGAERGPLYVDVKQGDVFEVLDGTISSPRTWLRTSLGLVNLDVGSTYNADYLASYTRVRIYPNATLVLEPSSAEHPLA